MSQYYWPVILLFATLVLLGFEMVIPSGGVIGICALLTYVASIIVAFANLGCQIGTAYLISTMVVATILSNIFIRFWPKTAIGRRIFGTPPTSEEVIPARQRALDEMIGKRGRATSSMLPSGGIRVDGRTLDAVSDGMVIEAGTPIEIVAVKANHLVVRPLDPSAIPQTEAEAEEALDQPIDSLIQDPFQD